MTEQERENLIQTMVDNHNDELFLAISQSFSDILFRPEFAQLSSRQVFVAAASHIAVLLRTLTRVQIAGTDALSTRELLAVFCEMVKVYIELQEAHAANEVAKFN